MELFQTDIRISQLSEVMTHGLPIAEISATTFHSMRMMQQLPARCALSRQFAYFMWYRGIIRICSLKTLQQLLQLSCLPQDSFTGGSDRGCVQVYLGS